MSDSSASYHEPTELLEAATIDMHRALVSVQEELEAVDWYRQRADACNDKALKAILLHNMREEIEHACMLLEWLRRTDADFDEHMTTYLYAKSDDILAAEEEATSGNGQERRDAKPETTAEAGAEAASAPLRLTIGSLKEAK